MSRSAPASSGIAWGSWQPLALDWKPSAADLAETLDGGQSFRWTQLADPAAAAPVAHWRGTWRDVVVELRRAESGLVWRAPAAGAKRVSDELRRYLGGDTDWTALADALPWRSDAHLARCLADFPGLRLLRQPFGETLLGFLCSATKQIVQIKQMCALLAGRHGRALAPGIHRLPTWPELAGISEAELRACLLGFRARFIHGTAKYLAARPGWLEETEQLPYPAAKERLLELPGVGEKVADCVLLFGAGKFAAFPVDTWVLKSLARRYGLEGWKLAQVAHFGRTHFGANAGYAQQVLFAWERRFGGR